MQEGEESTPIGGEESVGGQPVSNSERAVSENAGQPQPEKVYDFVHQHFGVALQAGGPESRAAEAGGRRATASKPQETKSDSWHALKNLIRYQTSTTTTNEHRGYGESGNAFEAQWFGKNSDDDAVEPEGESSRVKSRLNWIPTTQGGPSEIQPETGLSSREVEPEAGLSSIEIEPETGLSSTEIEPEAGLPSIEETISSVLDDMDDLLDSGPEEPSVAADQSEPVVSFDQLDVDDGDPTAIEPHEVTDEFKQLSDQASNADGAHADGAQADEAQADEAPAGEAQVDEASLLDQSMPEGVPEVEPDGESGTSAAEARSKFGSMNAFERLQKRTKQQTEPKDKQATTGDMLEPVKPEDWETKQTASTEGATIMNEWCSTSTGNHRPVVPSLAELDSIPTPSTLQNNPNEYKSPEHKSFSISTPAAKDEAAPNRMSPDAVHQTNRASWLKAASEYSSSVIKAVTEQMKSLNSKPKKVTPESPEYQQGDVSEQSDDISSM